MKGATLLALLALGLMAGCAAPIQMSHPLEADPSTYNGLVIYPFKNEVVGEIDAGVCEATMVDAAHGIVDKELFPYLHVTPFTLNGSGGKHADRVAAASMSLDSVENAATGVADLYVTLLDYEKGSGFLRFLFGSLAGGGHVTMQIDMTDHRTHEVLASGTTKANITGSFASAKDVVGPLSKAITGFVESKFLHGHDQPAAPRTRGGRPVAEKRPGDN